MIILQCISPSVLSWSGTPDREHRADSQYRSLYDDMNSMISHQEINIKNSGARQHQQSRITNAIDTAKIILVGQNEQNTKNARRETENKNAYTDHQQRQQRQKPDQQTKNRKADIQLKRDSEQGKTNKEQTTLRRERKLEDWTKYSGKENTKTLGENGTSIPVKNYRLVN